MTRAMEWKDDTRIPFGIHIGTRLIDLPASYLLYLYDNGYAKYGLEDYIKDNLEILKKERENETNRDS